MVIEIIVVFIFSKSYKKIPGGDVFSRVGEWKDEVACDVLAVDDSETC